MILLTKLSGDTFVLNAELIKYVEALPDTFVTLTTGDRVVVTEPPEEVVRRTIEYHQHKQLMPSATPLRESSGAAWTT
ncbi:flagellar FlbD family protein [Aeoliella mucimassa]|uniref:Flagellar protein (FlbD) n=1 Tax=Aeoliella mucimassa TaxID=2527972 RepID=A0A518AKQ8_9BACT|nr:flagellar FlbD family protein [Aeoliella mucimassa]QDU55312.1 Flagellar protein (FlbD) [Aeoliella mucimassa]